MRHNILIFNCNYNILIHNIQINYRLHPASSAPEPEIVEPSSPKVASHIGSVEARRSSKASLWFGHPEVVKFIKWSRCIRPELAVFPVVSKHASSAPRGIKAGHGGTIWTPLAPHALHSRRDPWLRSFIKGFQSSSCVEGGGSLIGARLLGIFPLDPVFRSRHSIADFVRKSTSFP